MRNAIAKHLCYVLTSAAVANPEPTASEFFSGSTYNSSGYSNKAIHSYERAGDCRGTTNLECLQQLEGEKSHSKMFVLYAHLGHSISILSWAVNGFLQDGHGCCQERYHGPAYEWYLLSFLCVCQARPFLISFDQCSFSGLTWLSITQVHDASHNLKIHGVGRIWWQRTIRGWLWRPMKTRHPRLPATAQCAANSKQPWRLGTMDCNQSITGTRKIETKPIWESESAPTMQSFRDFPTWESAIDGIECRELISISIRLLNTASERLRWTPQAQPWQSPEPRGKILRNLASEAGTCQKTFAMCNLDWNTDNTDIRIFRKVSSPIWLQDKGMEYRERMVNICLLHPTKRKEEGECRRYC